MAVVTGKSNLIPDPFNSSVEPPDAVAARGRYRVATGTLTNAADDSSGSAWHLCSLPSDAILQPGTFFDVENDGFAQIVIGTKSDTDALVDQAKSSENTITPIANGDANHGKHLWEVLGMAADPRGMIELWKHAEAGATGAGSMPFAIHWVQG